VAAGVVIGLLGGIALSRLVSGFLYGVAATDVLTNAAAAVDPMVALRQE